MSDRPVGDPTRTSAQRAHRFAIALAATSYIVYLLPRRVGAGRGAEALRATA